MKSSKHNYFIALFILTIIIIISITYFMGKRPDEQRLLNINTNLKETQEQQILNEIRQDVYSYEIDKPFAEGNYEYDERTQDFRLVCTRPCPVPKEILDQEFAAISYAVSTLRGLTQSDFNKEILPFEVHASEDYICPMIPIALAYMTTFTDSGIYNRGLLCFFFDKLNYNRDKFPYSTSIHEVTHLFEANKIEHNSAIWEGLSEMLESFFLKGNERNSFCWEGNAWFKQAAINTHDPHWVGGDLFFELCNQYGLDYDDLPELFRQIDAKGRAVTLNEFVSIINNIAGTDTTYLFRNAGVPV